MLTLLGLGLFLWRDKDVLNVDFRGGTVYAGKLKDGEERALLALYRGLTTAQQGVLWRMASYVGASAPLQ